MTDIYQSRYLAHQAKKKEQMTGQGEEPQHLSEYMPVVAEKLLTHRRSQRLFNSEPIPGEILDKIIGAATYAPNSCNRHGVRLLTVIDRTEKTLLSGILVGGAGWVHRADTVVLFIADPDAYKSPNEKDFMHYCDVGFTAMNMWLMAEAHNVGACYINPNIMPVNKPIFTERFGEGIFCGALALGNYDIRVTRADHPDIENIMI